MYTLTIFFLAVNPAVVQDFGVYGTNIACYIQGQFFVKELNKTPELASEFQCSLSSYNLVSTENFYNYAENSTCEYAP